MLNAFLYLTLTSARNRFRRQLARLRSPRYVVALLFALVYLGVVFYPSWTTEQAPAASLLTPAVLAVVSLAVLGLVAYWWLFGNDTGALAFSPAEVQFLFPAPVTRRQLIEFKLVRAQMVILVNIVLWTVILGRGRGMGELMWVRPISLWVLLSTFQLHRLGATLTRSNLTAHGVSGLRRSGLAATLLVAALAAVGVALARQWPAGGPDGVVAFLAFLETATAQPLARWALLPVRAVLAPLFATSLAAWGQAILPALLIMLLHFLWVVRSDSAFEDAAVEASAERARRLVARHGGVRLSRGRAGAAARQWLPLRPIGEPAVAVFWKNLLAVVRGDRFFKQTLIFGAGALVLGGVAYARPSLVGFATGVLSAWGGMLLLLGPMWLRNDLRADLRRLEVLRTYPIEPMRLVGAEIASSALVLSALEIALLVALFVTQLRNPDVSLPLWERVGVLLAAALALPALNGLATSIHNAAALLFPAWLPATGSDRKPGIEAMGQVYLVLIVMVLLLGLLLVAPALVGGIAYFVLRHQYGAWWSLVPAVLAGSAVIAGELLLIVRWLGRVFVRTEPSAVAASA